MSNSRETGSSGLSDWTLVNSQGELEGSDADSNASSIEIVGQEVESEEECHVDPISRDASPECIELEQLITREDGTDDNGGQQELPGGAGEVHSMPLQGSTGNHCTSFASTYEIEQCCVEAPGACSPQLLQLVVQAQGTNQAEMTSSKEVEGEPTLTAHLALECDTPSSSDNSSPATSSDSTTSISSVSSLSSTSKSSRTDSDSESDFVRLEKDSSCVNTESEGEESLSASRINSMTTSGSSVEAGFNFLCVTRALSLPTSTSPQPHHELPTQPPLQQQPPPQPQPVPPQEEIEPQPHEELLPPILGEQAEQEIAQEADADDMEDTEDEEEEAEVEEYRQDHQQQVAEGGAHQDDDEEEENDNDADTESSTEDGDQDDRIESEQSDDANSAPADDLDQGDLSALNDLGDVPLVRGAVERHYIHYNNQRLNGRLNIVVMAVLVLALGLGLGHWIGSTREHFSQLEIQLSQTKRLHQMQDEYMQCLSRNDELLIEADSALQGERDRHQEAMSDLRDNNRELQEQLQEAQDQLEQVLIAATKVPKSPRPSTYSAQAVLAAAALLAAGEEQFNISLASLDETSQQHLLQARQSLFKTMENKQVKQLQQLKQEGADREHQLNLALQEARQRLNSLEVENGELKVNVGKMRYSMDGPSVAPLPPPPRPVPPPPLAEASPDQGGVAEEHPQEPEIDGVEAEPVGSLENSDNLEEHADIPLCGLNGNQRVSDDASNAGEEPVEADREQKSHLDTEHCTDSPRPVPVDITLLQRNLTQERQRAEMWRRLYLLEQKDKHPEMNASTCLQLLTRHMNVSLLLQYISHWNLTGRGFEDFTDLTSLLSGMAQLHQHLLQSVPSLWDELTSTLQDLHHTFADSKEEPSQDTDSEGGGQEGDPTGSFKDRATEGGKKDKGHARNKAQWTDGVKKLLNKTRGTLSNVSRHLQKTWNQVKDASSHFWSGDDSVIGRMAASVKNGVRNLSQNVQKRASRWFKKRSKGSRKSEERGDKSAFQFEANVVAEEEKKQTSSQVEGISRQTAKSAKEEAHHFESAMPNHGKRFKKNSKEKPRYEVKSEEHGHKDSGIKDDKMNGGFDHHRKAPHHRNSGEENRHDSKGHRESERKETQFRTLAKHHFSHQQRAAEKARYKTQKQFNKLFSKIAKMSMQDLYRMDGEDKWEMKEDISVLLQVYLDNKEVELPDSGCQWLQCQFTFWMRATEHNHIRYDPKEICLRYLAPWQLGFVQELRERVEIGECYRKCKYFGADGSGQEEEENEICRYICIDDAEYMHKKRKHDDDDDDDDDDEDDDFKFKRKSNQPQVSPKGHRESNHNSVKSIHVNTGNTKSAKENDEHRESKAVNDTDDGSQTWYFQWVAGRDNLRTMEHKADWLFERAADRGETRNQQHSADWVFARAADRDASRDIKKFESGERGGRDHHNKWHRGKSPRHHPRKHHEKHHGRREKPSHFKHHDRDHRQRYGQASFCHFC